MITWLYTTNNDNSARYSLGKLGDKMLYFVGINPSTAKPEDLDRTVARVENFAFSNGYTGWVMLNVYAQRATKPNDMHEQIDLELHQEHMQHLKQFVNTHKYFDICAAWGVEITRRNYLKDCLKDLVAIIGYDTNWLYLHKLTKHDHPRHPLYLPSNSKFLKFDIKQYIDGL